MQPTPQEEPAAAWDALLVESEQLREELVRESEARELLALQVLQLQARCEQLQMALDAADGDARRERDAAGQARGETARVEAAAREVADELTDTRDDLQRVTTELSEVQRQANALKEVASISKRMLVIREEQVCSVTLTLYNFEVRFFLN